MMSLLALHDPSRIRERGHTAIKCPTQPCPVTLILASGALLLYACAGPIPHEWVYDRTAVMHGEIWRGLTGHFTHSDGTHVFWDVTALVILGMLFESSLRSHFLTVLVIGVLSVNAGLWWGMPALQQYCGLSGILNTVLMAGLIQQATRSTDRWERRLLLCIGLGALLKIAIEIALDSALFTQTHWPAVPLIHAAGAFGGLLWGAFYCLDIYRTTHHKPLPNAH